MTSNLTPQTGFEATDAKTLIRDSLAQCCGEALLLLRRAEQDPEHARQYTELARKLMRTCADLIAALNAPAERTVPLRHGKTPHKTAGEDTPTPLLPNRGTIRCASRRKRRKRA